MRVCVNRWAWAAAAALLAAVLPGCRRHGSVTLVIWSAPTGVEEKGFLRLCARFEREHPGIRIHNVGALREENLVRAVVAGVPPDIAYLYGTSDVGPLAANGALRPLDDLYAASGFRDDEFLPAAIAQGRYRGRLYAMPVTRDCHGLYWNRDVFRQAGLDPNRPPRTLEELEEWAKRLTITRPDGTLQRAGFMAVPDDSVALLCAMGARLYDPASNRLLLTSPETVAALTRLVELVDSMGGRSKLAAFKATFGRASSAQNPLATGKVAISIEGEWVSMYLQKYSPDCDYGIGRIPGPAGRADLQNIAYQDGDVFLVPAGARHPQAAWDFIRWMLQPRQQEEYSAVMNNLPAIRALQDSPMLTRGSRQKETLGFILREIAAGSPNSRFFPTLPVSRYYRDVLANAVESAELHQKTPNRALADAQARVEEEMARYTAAGR